MKEQLIANLKRENWDFEDLGDHVIIKDFFNLHVIVSFQAETFKIGGGLKGFNHLSGHTSTSLEQATKRHIWEYFIAGAMVPFALMFLEDRQIITFSGFVLFLFFFAIVRSMQCIVYWSRYNTISTQIRAWLRPSYS